MLTVYYNNFIILVTCRLFAAACVCCRVSATGRSVTSTSSSRQTRSLDVTTSRASPGKWRGRPLRK